MNTDMKREVDYYYITLRPEVNGGLTIRREADKRIETEVYVVRCLSAIQRPADEDSRLNWGFVRVDSSPLTDMIWKMHQLTKEQYDELLPRVRRQVKAPNYIVVFKYTFRLADMDIIYP